MDSDTNTNANATAQAQDPEQALLSDIESLESELANQRNLYMRLAADFDNFRKRTTQDVNRRAAAQKEEFIRQLLPVIDNLERGVASDESLLANPLREGVKLTLQQLQQLLQRHGIEPESADGKQFDPHREEAVATRQDPSKPDQAVLETFQKGYRRGSEVFRPAKVVVNDLSHAEAVDHGC